MSLHALGYIFRSIVVIALLTFTQLSVAKQTLKVGVGNFPPFFIEQGQQGLFIEITNEIFSRLPDYQIQYVFMSNRRLAHEISQGKMIDVACNIFANTQVDAHLSLPLFRYTDVAVTRKSANHQIATISDLQGLSIAAYQGAKDLLGEEFKQMAEQNPGYSEHSHPKETSFLMVSGSKDVRVGDINIFLHDLKNEHIRAKTSTDLANFNIHHLWPNVYSHMAFKDQQVRNKVDEVIKELLQNGVIEQIYQKYQIQ